MVDINLAENPDWAEEAKKPPEERNWIPGTTMTTVYRLTAIGLSKDVTRAEWIKAERQAGFRPYSDNPDACATGGFTGWGGLGGSIHHEWQVGPYLVKYDGPQTTWAVFLKGQIMHTCDKLLDAIDWAKEQNGAAK